MAHRCMQHLETIRCLLLVRKIVSLTLERANLPQAQTEVSGNKADERIRRAHPLIRFPIRRQFSPYAVASSGCVLNNGEKNPTSPCSHTTSNCAGLKMHE